MEQFETLFYPLLTLSTFFALFVAKKAATALKKGSGRKATTIHTKVHFYRPKTLKLARNPKFVVKASKSAEAPKAYDVIKYPLTTETALKMIEENNTLIFIVNITANKRQIKEAVKTLYDIKAAKVNTLIRFAKRAAERH